MKLLQNIHTLILSVRGNQVTWALREEKQADE